MVVVAKRKEVSSVLRGLPENIVQLWHQLVGMLKPSAPLLFGFKIQFIKATVVLFPINVVELDRVVKSQTAFINQALTKPSLPGGFGISAASLILLPSPKREQRLAARSCLDLTCHAGSFSS